MNRLPFLLLTFLLVASPPSFALTNGTFQLHGRLSGFADSTLVYLDDVTTSSGVRIDSGYLLNHEFKLSGNINEAAVHVRLRIKNSDDYKYFWLESAPMKFEAAKGKFRDAIIEGSATQNEQKELDAAIKATGKDKEQSILFISNHPNSIISSYILNVYASTWGKDTATILYRRLSDKIKKTSNGKDILEFITLNKNVKVGDRYIDFTQPNIEGKRVSLSDFDGKFTLLEFWGSWCGPCRANHPELVKIYNEFKGAGFEILGVAADDNKQDWTEAVRKDSLVWKNVSDLKGDKNKAALIYGISYYPANFLIDRTGRIIAKDLRGDALRKKLNEIFK